LTAVVDSSPGYSASSVSWTFEQVERGALVSGDTCE
jgi:hypothetical protein